MIIAAAIFIIAGLFFFMTATIGFIRFPDFYSRMHATGKGDTFGLLLCILGLVIYKLYVDPTWLGVVQCLKLFLIAAFWFLASPTATHALLRSAFETGFKPWTKDKKAELVDRTENKTKNKGVK